MNHYETLGVQPSAVADEIRRAYLLAARRHHPDRHVEAPAAERAEHEAWMRALNEAWEVLGDPDRRAGYDVSLRGPAAPPTARIRPDHGTPPGKGWTPRRGDTAWMHDFDRWRDEDERLPEDPEVDVPPRRRLIRTLPGLLMAVAIVVLFVGLALSARPVLAAGFAFLVISAGLFVLLPLIEMARSGSSDE